MVLVCHVILQDQGIKGLSDMMGRSHSTLITILPRLVAIDTMVAEILWFQFVTILRDF